MANSMREVGTTRVYTHDDSAALVQMTNGQLIAAFVICDDCRQAYLEPPYYTFETGGCTVDDEGTLHDDAEDGPCTGNMCPACAGPYLDPDKENDPRRPWL